MSEQPLEGMEIGAGLEHVGRIAVTKEVNSAWLVDLGTELGLKEGLFEPPGAEIGMASLPTAVLVFSCD